jgi:hypothetical protein
MIQQSYYYVSKENEISMMKTYLYSNAHYSFIHNSQGTEST